MDKIIFNNADPFTNNKSCNDFNLMIDIRIQQRSPRTYITRIGLYQNV